MQKYKNILKNRKDAAKKLTDVIDMHKLKEEQWNIVAVSKGGLKLGSFLRGKLNNSLDLPFFH